MIPTARVQRGESATARCASTGIVPATPPCFFWSFPPGGSNRPANEAAGESQPEAYPQGYVEDFDESRTKLGAFFSSRQKNAMLAYVTVELY